MEAGIAPEENSALREGIEAAPARYLEIPGRGHDEHHDLLRDETLPNTSEATGRQGVEPS